MARKYYKTRKAERIALYMEQIRKLRMGDICMNNEMMVEAVHQLVALNRKFEKEDNPYGS
jgi:hypothetical protein